MAVAKLAVNLNGGELRPGCLWQGPSAACCVLLCVAGADDGGQRGDAQAGAGLAARVQVVTLVTRAWAVWTATWRLARSVAGVAAMAIRKTW